MRRRESRDCSVLPLTIIDIAFFSSWLSLLYELLSRFTFCYFDTSKSLFSPNTVTRYFKEFWTTINISAYEWNVTSCATTLHIAAAIHSFSGTVHLCNVKMCSNPLLPTHFLLGYFKISVTVKQTYGSSYIFRAATIILKWEQPFQVVTSSQNLFTKPSSLEQLLLSNNYFLIVNTSSDQLLLEDKYFFSVQMMLWRNYFFGISNYLEHVFFRSMQFFQTATFSENELFRSRSFLRE